MTIAIGTLAAAQTNAATAATSATGAVKSRTELAGDLNQFLTLLTAQLQNQDPLSPLDTNQFTSQLVQFAQVEQTIATNENLEKMIDQNDAAELTSLGSLIGQTVEATSDRFVVEEGAGSATYELETASDKTRIRVMDELGRIIAEAEGQTGTGRHDFVWDARMAGGQLAPDGIYRIAATAVAADGSTTPLETSIVGVATGAVRSGQTLSLQIGPLTVAAGKVNGLRVTDQAAD